MPLLKFTSGLRTPLPNRSSPFHSNRCAKMQNCFASVLQPVQSSTAKARLVRYRSKQGHSSSAFLTARSRDIRARGGRQCEPQHALVVDIHEAHLEWKVRQEQGNAYAVPIWISWLQQKAGSFLFHPTPSFLPSLLRFSLSISHAYEWDRHSIILNN